MSDLTSFPDLDGTGSPNELEPSARPGRMGRFLVWGLVALFFLVLFTLFKLPEERVRNYVQGTIAATLAQQDIGFTAEKSGLSIGLGIHYTMRNITLTFPTPQEPVRIEEVSFTPSLVSLFTGKMGATVEIDNKGGEALISFSQPMFGKSNEISVGFKADKLDLGALGVLPALANLRGAAVLTGSGNVDGDPNVPSTLNGGMQVDLARIGIDAQTVLGFAIPALNISQAHLDVGFDRGKATIKTFTLGKAGNASDDIQGNITGDMTLGRSWPTSTLGLRADFRLSTTVLKAFPLLDALLGDGKQADGSFSYKITGPTTAPMPQGLRAGK